MAKQYTMRFDETIFLKLKIIAKAERRPFNSQVEYFLDRCIGEYEAEKGEIPVDINELYE